MTKYKKYIDEFFVTWIEDENNNKSSFGYFGNEKKDPEVCEEKAIEALESLKNCTNCKNCERCTDCDDCHYCSDRKGCKGCYGRKCVEGCTGEPNEETQGE